MKSKFVASGLAIGLGMAGAGTIGFANGVVAQAPVHARKVEADRLLQQGIQQHKISQFEAAFKSWQQALKLYREIKDRLGEGNTLGNMGITYLSLSNYHKAIEFHEQRLAIARELKDRLGEGQSLNNLGNAYNALGSYSKAIEFHQQHLVIAHELKDRQGEGNAVSNLGLAYDALGNYPKAIEFYGQRLAITRELKDRQGEGQFLRSLGKAYYNLDNYHKAIEFHEQRLAIARELKDRLSEGSALSSLGLAYFSLGNYRKAIELHEQSLAIDRKLKDRLGEGRSLGNLGIAYDSLGNYPKAIEFYQQSLAIARELKDRQSEGKSFGNLGITYLSLGNYPKAIEFYQQSLAIARELKDRQSEGQSLGNLGTPYLSLGNYPKAIEFYQQWLSLARELKDRRSEGQSLGGLGTAYLSLGNYPKAMGFYEQYLAIARELKDRQGEGNALGGLGNTYYALGNYPKAIEFHEQYLAIVRELKDRQGEWRALNNLGFILTKQEPELAIVFYKQSVNVSEGIRKDNRKLDKNLQSSYTETVAGTYRRLADLLLDQGRIGEAQQVLELLKIQEINDSTKGTRSATTVTQVPLTQIESEIIAKYNSLIEFGTKLSKCEQDRCAELETYRTQRSQLTTAYNTFVKTIVTDKDEKRREAIDIGTKTFIKRSERIVTAQPNSLLIYPLVLKDKIRILWAAKGGILSQAECPLGEAELSKLTEQFRTALQTTDDLNPVQKTGQQLYECLFPKKLQDELTKNKIENLIFVPDRATNYIPMAALHDGKQYLIQRFAVSNILATEFTDTQDKLPKQPTILGFGLSQATNLTNPTRTFTELPYVPAELNGIIKSPTSTKTTPGIFSGTTWLDRNFTRKQLENSLLTEKTNILHFATHGEFVPTEPSQSYLVLGDSSTFEISQVQFLTNLSNVHLVVLSACETALGGTDRNGSEIAGIASYFLGDQDKAKAVLASLWKVNDPATSLLMTKFYDRLAEGKLTKSHALRQVQLDLINSKLTIQDAADRAGARRYEPDKKRPQNLSHPYYWAPFILIGNSL